MTTIKINKKAVELRVLTVEQAQQKVNNIINSKWNDLTLEKNYRKIANMIVKEDTELFEEINQKEVEKIEINIEWKRSRTWGNNPHAEARVYYKDGSFEYTDGFSASGCGYDKESTVISQIFDRFLKYRLHALNNQLTEVQKGRKGYTDEGIKPYGCRLGDYVYYEGGVGTNCYYAISEFIGGEFKQVASGKTFDSYSFEMK